MTAAIESVVRKDQGNMDLHCYHLRVAFLMTVAFSAGLVFAQDRESLTKPVFRVNNEDVASAETQGTTGTVPPERLAALEAMPKPMLTKPMTKPVAKPDPEVVPAMEKMEKKDSAVVELASREPLSVVPAEPTPADKLGFAIADAKDTLAHIKSNVRDYQCNFVKRERIDDELTPVERIDLKVRNRLVENGKTVIPFSVYMKFRSPKDRRNREILFVEGANNGKLLAKEGGSRGKWIPSVWLRPEGAFALRSSRYPISEVGMQRLTERLIESAESNDSPNLCKIKYLKGAKVNDRKCTYLEVVRDVRRPGPLTHNNVYLVQIFIDEEMNVPVRYAAYDWPLEPEGKARILEEYTYENVELNVGLTDEDFSKDNPKYNF